MRRVLLLLAVLVVVGAIAIGAGLVHAFPVAQTSGRKSTAGATDTARLRLRSNRGVPRRLAGTNAWRLTKPARGRQIERYATRIDVAPGEPLSLRVSTSAPTFRVEAYRFGWYRGGKARRVWHSGTVKGERQARPRFSDYDMRTIVAPWHESTVVSTTGWTPGAYVLKLVASTGWESDVPLIVRSPHTAGKVALVAPVTTWQAYNQWGGYSLYAGRKDDRRAWAVSFDRPFQPPGAGQMMFGVVPVVVRAERLGIPLAYLTNIDLDANTWALNGARGYVSMGHDEYWTPAMRQTVLDARDHGTNLAFLGADTEFWRIRLGSTATGPRRLVVGYRWDYQQDPQRTHTPGLTTGPFGSPPVPRPEEILTGMRYECFPVDAAYTVTSPRWWGFAGTHVRAGERFPHLVGVEADRVYPVRARPRPLQILSSSPYSCLGVRTSAQSVYFTTSSGAGVFNTGTLRWTCALQRRCGPVTMSGATVRFTRRVTANVFRTFARGPAGKKYPAHDNLHHYSLPIRHTVPAD